MESPPRMYACMRKCIVRIYVRVSYVYMCMYRAYIWACVVHGACARAHVYASFRVVK